MDTTDLEALSAFLGAPPPAELAPLVSLGVGLGGRPVDPKLCSQRMPLVFPLWADAEPGFVGLLLWPTPEPGMQPPVVRAVGHRLRCLAPSARDLLRQRLAELDLAGRALPGDASDVYQAGEAAGGKLDLLRWQAARAGGSPQHLEQIASIHLRNGDATAALVALELANTRFGGWACTHASRHRLLVALGRGAEARDAALAAIALPVWTLDGAFDVIARAAGWSDPIDGSPYRRRAAAAGVAPADRAAHLLDAAAVDGTPWAELREEVARCWDDAGLERIAAFARWRGC